MDTSILHKRIIEYKEKAKHPVSKEMILLFESWFLGIENYMSGLEIDNMQVSQKIAKLEKTVNILCDILIITGNADKIFTQDINDEYYQKAILLMLKSKNRNSDPGTIATLLYINRDKQFDTLKQLNDYVNR